MSISRLLIRTFASLTVSSRIFNLSGHLARNFSLISSYRAACAPFSSSTFAISSQNALSAGQAPDVTLLLQSLTALQPEIHLLTQVVLTYLPFLLPDCVPHIINVPAAGIA